MTVARLAPRLLRPSARQPCFACGLGAVQRRAYSPLDSSKGGITAKASPPPGNMDFKSMDLDKQVFPLHGFYKLLLHSSYQVAPPSKATPPPTSSKTALEPESRSDGAPSSPTKSTAWSTVPITSSKRDPSILFSGRLNSPDRPKATIAPGADGKIPPKPEEPDNCCMSGCVNCVWDLFREEMEIWQEAVMNATAQAKEKGKKKGKKKAAVPKKESVESWEQMEEIPVGIREFMKTEKRLRQEREQRA